MAYNNSVGTVPITQTTPVSTPSSSFAQTLNSTVNKTMDSASKGLNSALNSVTIKKTGMSTGEKTWITILIVLLLAALAALATWYYLKKKKENEAKGRYAPLNAPHGPRGPHEAGAPWVPDSPYSPNSPNSPDHHRNRHPSQPHPSCPLPPGSWSQSCTGGTMIGSTLLASCDNSDGQCGEGENCYQPASLNLAQCGGGDVSNVEGNLVCPPITSSNPSVCRVVDH